MKMHMNYIVGLIFCGLISTLCAGNYSGGSGTQADPYQIATKADLLELAVTPEDYSSCFILTADIDLVGEIFTAAVIAPDIDNTEWMGFQGTQFTGIFDGNNHIISSMHIVALEKDFLGLFGCIGSKGHVNNLEILNATIKGRNDLGGLCGMNCGTIKKCSINGIVEGYYGVGGVCGSNEGGEVLLCCSRSSVSGNGNWHGGIAGYSGSWGNIAYCWSASNVSGVRFIGGLVGSNTCEVKNCYATGTISGSFFIGGLIGYTGGYDGDWYDPSFVQACYSTCTVNGSSSVGGLVGYGYNIYTSFWDIQTSMCNNGIGDGYSYSNGVVGKTTSEMKTVTTYFSRGWDFLGEAANGTEDIWRMCVDGVDYPRLSWEKSIRGDFSCPDGVGGDDLQQLIQDWLSTYSAGFRGSDANGDREVNLSDYLILAKYWME